MTSAVLHSSSLVDLTAHRDRVPIEFRACLMTARRRLKPSKNRIVYGPVVRGDSIGCAPGSMARRFVPEHVTLSIMHIHIPTAGSSRVDVTLLTDPAVS